MWPSVVTIFAAIAMVGASISGPTRDVHASQAQTLAGYTFVEIDDPNGARGTRAWGLNANGVVVGSYDDSNDVRHGFIWRDGRFTTVDHPDAGHGPPCHPLPQGTTLYDINGFGDITGRYINSNCEFHGFLLRHGMFTPIDDPAAHHGSGFGTQADGINDADDIVGDFTDEDQSVHGFVLHDGAYTTIDAPHAEHGRGFGTHAFGIDDDGEIVVFTEPTPFSNPRGFLLRGGRFTRLDDPHGAFGTNLNGINATGEIVGLWVDGNNVEHGLSLCHGVFTTHDAPNAGRSSGQGTELTKVDSKGDAVGWYVGPLNRNHGFMLIKNAPREGSCDR